MAELFELGMERKVNNNATFTLGIRRTDDRFSVAQTDQPSNERAQQAAKTIQERETGRSRPMQPGIEQEQLDYSRANGPGNGGDDWSALGNRVGCPAACRHRQHRFVEARNVLANVGVDDAPPGCFQSGPGRQRRN